MVHIYPLDRNCMHYCFTCEQIVLWSLVAYFALALYFYPKNTLSPLNFDKAGLLVWVHTCHFHMHVAGWVGPLPHLSFHSLPGGACASLDGSALTLQGVSLPPLFHYSLLGCVAATLIALLIITGVCRCHPHFMLGCIQQPVVPFTAKYCVLIVSYGVAFNKISYGT